MPSISLPTAILGAGALGLAGSAVGAYGATTAAGQQAAAMQQGQVIQEENLAKQQKNFSPYMSLGSGAANTLGGTGPLSINSLAGVLAPGSTEMNALTQPFNPTMTQLESTPGYQFTLGQGLQTVANAYSGQGLGNGVSAGQSIPSGAEAKGAVNYAEGLASTTYQQQFQNYWAQNANIYNLMSGGINSAYNYLTGGAQMGEQATAALSGVAQNATNQVSGLQSGIGAANAAGTVGATNALGGALNNIGGGLQNYAMINALGGGSSLFGGSSDPFAGVSDANLATAFGDSLT